MHTIVKSEITERNVQHDGRVYVTEVHTFDDGMEYSTTYLADAKADQDGAMKVRAIELETARETGEIATDEAKLEASIVAKRDQYVASLDDATLKGAVKLTDDELAAFKKSALADVAAVDDTIKGDPGVKR